jgi:hypothetical protein
MTQAPGGRATSPLPPIAASGLFERYLQLSQKHYKQMAAQRHKNKTVATFLALILGGLGTHRFYLKGGNDRLGLLHLCSVPVAGMVYGLGHAPNPFWVLLPLLVSTIVAYIEALVIGLTPDEKWDEKYNPDSGRSSNSNWLVVVLLVAVMLAGTTMLIATMARLFDLIYTGGAFG